MGEEIPMLTFYYSPGACSLATHVTLEEVGAEFEPRPILLAENQQRTEAYLKVNPRGRVPALVLEDGTVLTETVALLTYLARRFPEARLLPDDSLAEIRCLSLMTWLASAVHPTFTHVRRPERFTTIVSAHRDVVELAAKNFWGHLQEIDRALDGRRWFFGERVGVCDLYSLVFYNWGYRTGHPVRELLAFTALKDELLTRPAVRRALEREQSPLLETV